MKSKLIILGAVLVLFAVALYVSGNFGEEGGYAQARQERQAILEGQDSPDGPGTLEGQGSPDRPGMLEGLASLEKQGASAGEAGPNGQGAPDGRQGADRTEAELEEAPDFTLKDLNGNVVSLRDLRGKAVYLNFWTTWCKWCKKEMPAMKRVYESFKGTDLAIVAVDIGEDRDKVASYIERGGYPFQVLLDSDKSVSKSYRVTSIPVSVFVDKEGRIAYRKLGTMKEDEMRSVVESLVE
ncbi:TlpA family protein disulfide reductase [Cohnella sp. GCM10020058]|uniref:TlpA family protein disulfide reductase n=1 Tax=Cohnella sp. GCM10020058 TaxID=3317330 RepID=UPI0036398B71